MIRALIVDDEEHARNRLRRMLADYPEIDVVGEGQDGVEAIRITQKLLPDVMFLDVNMHGLNGLEVALSIGDNGPKIIFVTAYEEYAIKAFETYAIDYLVKPISQERLALSVKKLKDKLKDKTPKMAPYAQIFSGAESIELRKIVLKEGGNLHVLDMASISVLEAQDQYVEVVVGDRRILVDETLERLMHRLDSRRFFRIHRSYIINLDFLEKIQRDGDRKYTALLRDKAMHELPISRSLIESLKQKLLV